MPNILKNRVLSRTQCVVIFLGIVAQLSFVATIKHYLLVGSWGYTRFGWIIPNQKILLGTLETSSNSLITFHLISSYCLYLGLLTQFSLMIFFKRVKVLIFIHRIFGFLVTFVLLPAFLTLSLALTYFLIHNPINQLLFAIIPLMIGLGVIKGVLAIQKNDKERHIDGMFLALALMNTASVFRLLVGILFLTGVPVDYLLSNGEPNHVAALARTILMILILTLSFKSSGRLAANKGPINLLILVCLIAIFMHFVQV